MSDRIQETRNTPGTVALRAAGDGTPRIGGYAIMWNRLSNNLGGFVERADPGCCNKSLGDRLDVLCRFQHRDEYLLGRVSAGTHRLAVDTTGLDYEVDPPDTQTGRDVTVLAGRNELRTSFAFFVPSGGDDWSLSEQGYPLRTLLGVELVDTAPVVQPAYPDTTTGLRSLAEHRGMPVEDVRALAAQNKLADLLKPSPTIVDLGAARSAVTPTDSGAQGIGEQGATHSPIALRRRRLELDKFRAPAGF